MADSATVYKNEGNKAFTEGRFQEAVDAFTKAIEINPNDHVFYSNRSGAYASLDQLDEALEDANKCIALKADWAKGYQRKGHAQYELGKLQDAIETYKAGLNVEPTNAILKERLSKVEEELKESSSSSAGGKGGNGFDSIATQIMMKLAANPRTAEWLKDPSFMSKLQMLKTNPSMFGQLMQQDPRISEAFNMLIGDFGGMAGAGAAAAAAAGGKQPTSESFATENQGGEETADYKIEEEDINPQPTYTPFKHEPVPPKKEAPKPKKEAPTVPEHEKVKNQGNDFYKAKNFQSAIECYNKAIELCPQEVLYYNNKAAVFIELKDYTSALAAVDDAIKAYEEHEVRDFQKLAKIFARKASVLHKMEDFAGAIQWYEKSLLEDTNPKVKLELKLVQKLKKDQEQLAFINPEIAEEHNEKAKALFVVGNFPDALKEYSNAILRNPKDPKYLTNRGTCYVKLMEIPSALRDFDQALLLDSKYVKAHSKKGNCHIVLKEYHKAIAAFEKGLEIQPDNQEMREQLQKAKMTAYGNSNQADQEERAKHAMADPEIQQILRTPEVQNALKSLQQDPKEAAKIMNNPTLAPKIAKLVEAGILRMG